MFKLIIGNRAYSSWSFRGWLACKQSGEAFEELVVPMFDEDWDKRREGDEFAPSLGKVPILWDGDIVVWDNRATLHRARQGHGRPPYLRECPAGFDSDIHMHASRPAGLGPPAQPYFFEEPLHFEGNAAHVAPRNAWYRIQIDTQFIGMLKVAGTDRMRMEFDATQIDYPGEASGVVHNNLFGGSARRE